MKVGDENQGLFLSSTILNHIRWGFLCPLSFKFGPEEASGCSAHLAQTSPEAEPRSESGRSSPTPLPPAWLKPPTGVHIILGLSGKALQHLH